MHRRLAYISLLPLLLVAAASGAKPEVVVYDLTCNVEPDAGRMTVDTTVLIRPEWIRDKKVTFGLAKIMEAPVVELIDEAGKATAVETKEVLTTATSIYRDVILPVGAKSLRFKYGNSAKKGFVFYMGPEGCFAGGYNETWYPRIGNFRSEGKWRFSVPPPYVVKAPGKQVAARSDNGRTIYEFEANFPTILTFAAAKYIVKRIEGTPPVTLYVLKERPHQDEYAKGCWRILKVLQGEFGKYPFPEFSIVETPSPQSNEAGFSGASFEGFMFGSSWSLDQPFNTAYFGHEMGHQWWGNLVQKSGPEGSFMMSEALAQYGSLQAVDQIEGKPLASTYRFKGYPWYNDRQCGYWTILYGPTGLELPLAKMPASNDVIYHQLANAKGFLAWDAIAREIGRDRFRRAMRSVTSKYGWRTLTFRQFLDEIQAASGRDLTKIFDQWLYRTGTPTLSIAWKNTAGGLEATLQQKAPYYDMEVPVEIRLKDGARKRVNVRIRGAAVTFRSDGQADDVVLDPDYEVLHSTPELDEEAQALKYFTRGHFSYQRGNREQEEKEYREGLASLPHPDKYKAEFTLRFFLANLLRQTNRLDEAKKHYEIALSLPTRKVEELPWIYLRLAQIAHAQSDPTRVEWAIHHLASAEAALARPRGALEEARRDGLLPP